MKITSKSKKKTSKHIPLFIDYTKKKNMKSKKYL